ncbi:hypothetical protein BDV93DRAFT_249946 [Ceratobasidium sp. AG-I]|nr:hypothetical protein BDV93DRAFT_249946 [Ceratobasidium sp. AG-I]
MPGCRLRLHTSLFIHLGSILTCRPFLSPRPLSEDAIRLDATTDISQPTHSSHLIRRYRTLAFRVARASALQITSLIRYIPLSSPCVTLPYLVYSACTILLLAPDDIAAMDGVRTSVACLEGIRRAGYWAGSAGDAKERILALAKRWGVDIGQGRKVRGLVVRGRGRGDGGEPAVPSTGEDEGTAPGSGSGPDAESDAVGPSNVGDGAQQSLGSSSGTRSASRPVSGTGGTGAMQLSASTRTHDGQADPVATYRHGHSNWMQQYEDDSLARMYANQEYSGGVVSPSNHGYTVSLPRGNDSTLASDARYTTVGHDHGEWERTRNSHPHATRLVYADEPADVPTYAPQEQGHTPTQPVQSETRTYSARDNYSSQTSSGITSYEHQVQHKDNLVSAPQQQVYQQHQYHRSLSQQQSQHRPQFQYQPQQPQSHLPVQHHHVHIHQHYHVPPPSATLPHVAYALSHGDPLHDSHLPHTHWHQVLPSADPNLPFPPDPAACADLATCFADTIQTTQEEPAFVRSLEDPYASVAVDWLADVSCSFPAMTMETYAGSVGVSRIGAGMVGMGMSLNGGKSDMRSQDGETRRSYGHRHPVYENHGAGYPGCYES